MPHNKEKKLTKDVFPCDIPQKGGKSKQQTRYWLNKEGRFSYLESKMEHSILPPEKDTRYYPLISEHTPTLGMDSQPYSKEGHKTSMNYAFDSEDQQMHEIRPRIIGRVMSEIHSNLPCQDLGSEDFLHALVDQVIAEVANEMSIYDENSPQIYMAPGEVRVNAQVSSDKTKVLLNSQNNERTAVTINHEARQRKDYTTDTNTTRGELESPPVTVNLTVIDDSSSESLLPPPSENDTQNQRSSQRTRNYANLHSNWWTLFCIILALYLLYITLIFGAFLGLALCGPHPCTRNWGPPNPFMWAFLYNFHAGERTSELYAHF